jgi:ribose transport system substrate-binding protein
MGVGSDAVQQKASLDEAAKQGIVIVGWRKSVFANVTPNAMEVAKVAAMKAIAENMQGWQLADELNRRL